MAESSKGELYIIGVKSDENGSNVDRSLRNVATEEGDWCDTIDLAPRGGGSDSDSEGSGCRKKKRRGDAAGGGGEESVRLEVGFPRQPRKKRRNWVGANSWDSGDGTPSK